MARKTPVLSRDSVVYAIDAAQPPRTSLDAPAEVTIETHDARAGRLRSPADVETTAPDYLDRFPRANPATGPIFIRGAQPGDTLVVDVLAIDLDERGYVLVKPGFGVIADMVERPVARMAAVVDGAIRIGGVALPLRPMIGVMATAPAGEPVGTAYVGSHGGNMDCNLIAVGARVRLPVRVPGGLLFVGDIHAAMGDGEVSGSGFEIGAKVRLRLDLEKGGARGWPSVETADRYATIASAPDFHAAAEIALRELIVWLGRRHGVDPLEAYMLATLRGDLRVNQACRSPVDISLRMEFPKL